MRVFQYRNIFLLSLLLPILIAIPILVFAKFRGDFILDKEDTFLNVLASFFEPSDRRSEWPPLLNGIPLNLNEASIKLLVAAPVIAIGMSILSGIVACAMWSNEEKRMYMFSLPIMMGVAGLAALGSFIAVFVLRRGYATFSPYHISRNAPIQRGPIDLGLSPAPPYGPNGRYDGGQFDLEAWTCAIGRIPLTTSTAIFRRQCDFETASRWLLLPLWISLLASAVVGWWMIQLEDAMDYGVMKLGMRMGGYD